MDVYIDGFLLVVPADKIQEYAALARKAGAIWKEHGALDYRECAGDELHVQGFRSFAEAAGAKDGEIVVMAWITYANKAERNRINAAVMADERLKDACPEGVFDFQRMACGGFTTLASA